MADALLPRVEAVPHTGLAITQTVVALAADTSTRIVAENATRRYLAIVNIGVGNVNLGFGGSATVNSGFPLDAASAAGRQGGGVVWEGAGVPSGAVHGRSLAGTSVVVLEG
jgi:hypothetical protein